MSLIAEKIKKYLREESQNSKKCLNEAMDYDPIIKKIEKATNNNDHTVSIIILAKEILRNSKMTDALIAIDTIHKYYRHMPKGLMEVRNDILKMALEEAKARLPKEVFEKLRRAF